MDSYLKIGNLTFHLLYLHEKYLSNQFARYAINFTTKIDYKIETYITAHIPKPLFEPQLSNSLTWHYGSDDLDYYVLFSDETKSEIVEEYILDKVGHQVYIYINPQLVTDTAYKEYLLLKLVINEILILENHLIFYASSINYNDYGIIFTGLSKSGKSTHARYWKELFEDQVSCISDDKTLVYFDGNEIYMIGCPFSYSQMTKSNPVRLKLILVIEPSSSNIIQSISDDDKSKIMYENIVKMVHQNTLSVTKKNIDMLLTRIPIYKLKATHDKSAAILASEMYQITIKPI